MVNCQPQSNLDTELGLRLTDMSVRVDVAVAYDH
jgi:hypothetical protein